MSDFYGELTIDSQTVVKNHQGLVNTYYFKTAQITAIGVLASSQTLDFIVLYQSILKSLKIDALTTTANQYSGKASVFSFGINPQQTIFSNIRVSNVAINDGSTLIEIAQKSFVVRDSSFINTIITNAGGSLLYLNLGINTDFTLINLFTMTNVQVVNVNSTGASLVQIDAS